MGGFSDSCWVPTRHLRCEAVKPERQNPADVPYATDWYLEHDGGITKIRMVASGFGEGPEWDHEYDGSYHGWDLFHQTMKHNLEEHRGQSAANVVLYAMLEVTPAEAWARLMSPAGLIKEGGIGDVSIGAPFRFVTSQGDVLAGVVRNYVPGKTFAATFVAGMPRWDRDANNFTPRPESPHPGNRSRQPRSQARYGRARWGGSNRAPWGRRSECLYRG